MNRTVVTHMLSTRGTVAAELTVTQIKENEFLIITGSGSEGHDLRWMERLSRKGNWNIKLKNVTEDLGVLSVVGPKSKDILSKLSERFKEKFPFFTADEVYRIFFVPYCMS